jgi:hypothetical protein
VAIRLRAEHRSADADALTELSESLLGELATVRAETRMRVDSEERANGHARATTAAVLAATVDQTLVDGTGLTPTETTRFREFARVSRSRRDDAPVVAGHVVAPDGTIDAEVAFSQYVGDDTVETAGEPWLDLSVYDAERSVATGESAIVASTGATQGYGHTSVDVTAADSDVYYVVLELVHVPGIATTDDVEAHVRLSGSFTAAARPALAATGGRTADGSSFTTGETYQVQVIVSDVSEQVPDDGVVEIYDHAPWPLTDVGTGDATNRRPSGRVTLEPATAGEIRTGGVTRTYAVEAPADSGEYVFGAASVELTERVTALRTDTATVGGTETHSVVGADQYSTTATNDAVDRPD